MPTKEEFDLMDEYIGFYEEPYIQTYILKIKADSTSEAKRKFLDYLDRVALVDTAGVYVFKYSEMRTIE